MKNNLKEKLARWLYGRYGTDELNMAILVLALVISLIAGIAGLPLLSFVSLGLLIYVNYRAFSKNIAKRAAENKAWRNATVVPRRTFKAIRMGLKDHDHAYRLCPNCHQICRLPKGKDRIEVHCPSCKKGFEVRS